AAVEESPLYAVGHGCRDAGFLGRQSIRHLVQHGVERQIHVVAESAPQARSNVGRRVAISDGFRVVEPLGRRAVPVLSDVIPLAMAAGEVVLQEDKISLFQAFVRRESPSDPGEVAHVLVPHHQRATAQRQSVLAHIRPADARDLDLHQRRVIRNRWEVQFAELSRGRTDLQRGQYFFGQSDTSPANALPIACCDARTDCKSCRRAESTRRRLSPYKERWTYSTIVSTIPSAHPQSSRDGGGNRASGACVRVPVPGQAPVRVELDPYVRQAG